MEINIEKLRRGNWISNSSGIYEVVKIYKAAGGTFITVKEVFLNPENDNKFSLGEEYDMTPADVKKCHKFF